MNRETSQLLDDVPIMSVFRNTLLRIHHQWICGYPVIDCGQVSTDGKQFVTTSPDRRIRVFWFATGKLRRTYDESLEVFLSFERVLSPFLSTNRMRRLPSPSVRKVLRKGLILKNCSSSNSGQSHSMRNSSNNEYSIESFLLWERPEMFFFWEKLRKQWLSLMSYILVGFRDGFASYL